jgi:predicted alpha/beta-fold hydrolase
MARGKRLTLHEQLEKINQMIAEKEESLKTLQEQKTQCEQELKMNRLAELDELITNSGRSYEEIRELLSVNE